MTGEDHESPGGVDGEVSGQVLMRRADEGLGESRVDECSLDQAGPEQVPGVGGRDRLRFPEDMAGNVEASGED